MFKRVLYMLIIAILMVSCSPGELVEVGDIQSESADTVVKVSEIIENDVFLTQEADKDADSSEWLEIDDQSVSSIIEEPVSSEDISNEFYQIIGTYSFLEGVAENLVIGETVEFKIVEIFEFYPLYNPTWEYFEWGESVEYCNPDYYKDNFLPYSEFTVKDENGILYTLDISFIPSLYRSYKEKINNIDLIKVPHHSSDYKGGYTAEMIVVSNELKGHGVRYGKDGESAGYLWLTDNALSLNSIKNQEGVVLWDNTMTTAPREPNILEEEYFAKISQMDEPWNWVRDAVNIDPVSCTDIDWNFFQRVLGIGTSYDEKYTITPLEIVVRMEAAYEYFKDPSNNLWRSTLYNDVSIVGEKFYGLDTRWVYSNGNIIEPTFIFNPIFSTMEIVLSVPNDGVAILQSKDRQPFVFDDTVEYEDWEKEYWRQFDHWITDVEDIEWKNKLSVLVQPGDYISVDNTGLVKSHRRYNGIDYSLYIYTFDWDAEKILQYFNYDDELNTAWFYKR